MYLHEMLVADAHIRHWTRAKKLPYFLQDTFDVYELHCATGKSREILSAAAQKLRLWPKDEAIA
jgi:hypothetical protein